MTLLEQMAERYEAWMPSRLRLWYAPEERLLLATQEMRPQADHVANTEFGAGFRDHLRTLGGPDVSDPLAWANRRIEFSDGNWCVAGIRFLGLDPQKPFVSVVATSLPPEHDVLVPYAQKLHREFSAFAPLAIRFELPDPPADVDVDQWIVAGLVSQLREQPLRPQCERVRLIKAQSAEVVTYADEVLARIIKQTPEVATWTEAATLDQLTSCAETGALCTIEIDGQHAGIIAAARDDANGMRGFQVYEILLDNHARGHGFGSAAMQLLCRVLPAEAGDTLWGTVHGGNVASISNGLSVGREKTAAFVWIERRGEL